MTSGIEMWFAWITVVVGTLLVLMLVWFLGWQTGIRDARKKWGPKE